MQLVVISLISFVAANATLDKSGHMMYVEYSISEPTKDQGVVYVDILFHYKGETYRVARHRYPEPIASIVDTFPWVSKDRWEGGNLEVVAKKADGEIERSYISEESIEVRDLGYREPAEYRVNYVLVKPEEGFDPYAWRMVGYDAQHTGYYPYSLYPPLELKWTYTGPDADFLMLSGCAGNGMLYMPGGTLDENGWRLAQILAMDMETGEIVWKRTLTSNVWSAALSPDDSFLFVGTSIEPSLTQPTFFCLDARTGEILWSGFFHTVEFQPIVVNNMVYFTNLNGMLTSINVENWEVEWIDTIGGINHSPAYYNGKLYIGGGNKALLALDAMTGDTVWEFDTPDEVETDLVISDGRVFFFSQEYPDGILFALDAETGELLWEKHGFTPAPNFPLTIFNGKLYFIQRYREGGIVHTRVWCLDMQSGEELWSRDDIGGRGMVRSVYTSEDVLWVPSQDYLFRIDPFSGYILTRVALRENTWPTWYFPIVYKDFIVISHSSYLYVFKGSSQPFGEGKVLSVYPNPFSELVTFSINYAGNVSLDIYDLSGRFVRRVWEGVIENPPWMVSWEGDDRRGKRVAPGVYIANLKIENKPLEKTMIVFLGRR